MAISQVGGATNQSTTNVTTLSVTYAPTAGNIVVLFFTPPAAVTGITVQDNKGNNLTLGPAFNGDVGTGPAFINCYYQVNVPTGVTSYTVSWTTGVQCSIAVEEYSGTTSVEAVFTSNHALSSGSTSTCPVYVSKANNWVVCGFANRNNTMTGNTGNARQSTTTSTARILLMDNTSASIGTLNTIANTTVNSSSVCVGVELGNASIARSEQDVIISVNSPTSSLARVAQDVILSIHAPTSSKARVGQNVTLVIVQNNLLLKVHVKRYIVDRRKKPKLKKHWGHFQPAQLLASQPYTPILERGVKRVIVRQRKPKLKKHWGFFQKASLLAARPLGPAVVRGMMVVHRHQGNAYAHHIHMQRAMGSTVKVIQPFVFVSC